jgi:hypothetical protein
MCFSSLKKHENFMRIFGSRNTFLFTFSTLVAALTGDGFFSLDFPREICVRVVKFIRPPEFEGFLNILISLLFTHQKVVSPLWTRRLHYWRILKFSQRDYITRIHSSTTPG